MEYFHKAEDWLLKLSSEAQFFRQDKKPSLEVVNRVLDELGRPDESFEWRVVVGGTAGKGTVCRLTEDVLLRSGKKVATLMSPHLQVITERIRIGGKLIDAETFGETLLNIKKVCENLSIIPTYYEAIVLTGILAAKNSGCEILICEVGMGGRLDAVNSVRGKRVSALTFVGDDHLEKFENSIEKLAQEKAGIFVENSVYNVSYEQKMCSTLDSKVKTKIEYIKGIKAKLNKKLARRICKKILGNDTFIMRKIPLPCRWEKVASDVILDGAHSAPRFEFILPKIKKLKGRKIGIFAMAEDHDLKSFSIIENQFDEIIWTEVPGERKFHKAEELKKIHGRGVIETDPIKALKKAQSMEGTVIVLGSFYLAGLIREEFYSSENILKQQTEFSE
jgi:folylpolyglutamate synthase/dihydropteroate synthase